jgi:probable F420-dependent oxidoreductase
LHPFGLFPDVDAIVETVQRMEALGYDYVAIPEHTIFPTDHERKMGRVWYETLTLATHLAALTETIHFYTSAVIISQHHPIYLAKQAATLDLTSRGRFGLCVAGGWLEQEIEWLGGDVRRRGRTLEEYIDVMRELWRNDPASYAGETIHFENASFHPKPAYGVPIFVGGTPVASARRAARMGDGWMPSSSPQSVFADGVTRLRDELRTIGRAPEDFPIFRHVTLFELPDEIKEHTRETGAESEPGFGGDLVAAQEYIHACAELGVTHTTVLTHTDYGQLRDEIEMFAAAVIAPAQSAG